MAESYARFAGDVHKQYVWGLGYIDAPILRDRETDGGSAGPDERLYYTQDGNFNVTALVNPAGQVVERYSYDPYGRVTVRNGAENVDADTAGDPATEWDADPDNASDVDNRLLYCGYRFDSETGLYHVRHRYLHPTLGRWTTRDPLGYVDGMGLYEYVRSSPLNGLDPLGQWRFWDWVWTGDGNLIEETERQTKDIARKARESAVRTRREGDRESAAQLDRMAASLEHEGQNLRSNAHNAAKKAFVSEAAGSVQSVLSGHVQGLAKEAARQIFFKDCSLMPRGIGAVVGGNLSGSLALGFKFAGMGEGGGQYLALCDSCQVCAYAYIGGGSGAGLGASANVNTGKLIGYGVHEPTDYEGVSLNGSVSVGAAMGGYGEVSLSGNDYFWEGPTLPFVAGGGVSFGPGAGAYAVVQVQRVKLIGCIDVSN
jgi:RHS repeat-associated protein